MSGYRPEEYEARQAANDKSREFATRSGQPWTTQDDAVLLENWIGVAPAERDEARVARDVGRTIEAVRNRVHFLVGVHTGVRYEKAKPQRRYAWEDEWEEETGQR